MSQASARPTTEPSPEWMYGCPLFVGEVDPQQRQHDEQPDEGEAAGDVEPWVAAAAERVPADPSPEHDEPGERTDADHEHRCEQRRTLEREVGDPHRHD